MKTIYAIPGLGATKNLYKFIRIADAKIIVLDWPPLSKGETMKTYARKFSKQINSAEPFYLMGVSYGGMICSEISLFLKPKKTILISSCKCENEIPEVIKIFRKSPLHLILTERQLRELVKKSNPLLGFDDWFLPEFKLMVDSMKRNYFKYSMDCIIKWKNKNCKRKDIIHIHGDADRTLPYNEVKADYVIKGGTHGMVINNANEINVILNMVI